MERESLNRIVFKGTDGRYHYVYIVVNLINGKQYIGDHSTKNLNDYYIGSGTCFKDALKKYGKKSFYKQILEFFPTKKGAFDAQLRYINKFDTITPNGYNISPVGGLGCYESFSPQIKQKMKNNHADYKGENHPMFGKKHSKESIKKNSDSMIKFYQTEKGVACKKRLSELRKNKQQTKESNEKRRKTQTGRKRPLEVGNKISKSLLGKNHSEERKQKNRESQLRRMENPELRQITKEAALKQWANPEWKENHIGENYRKKQNIA